MKLQILRTIWPVVAVAGIVYAVPAMREGQTMPCGAFAVRTYLRATGGIDVTNNGEINAIIYSMGDALMSQKISAIEPYRSWPPELACTWLYWRSLVEAIPGAR